MKTSPETSPSWGRLLVGLIIGLGSWFVFVGTEPVSWLIGLPCIVLAAWAFACLTAPVFPRFCWWRVPGFFVWFLGVSVLAGWDVAWRALQPRMPLDPGLLRYRSRLPGGLAEILFGAAISLIPGTLLVRLDPQCLIIHVVDMNADVQGDLAALEARIGQLFGLELGADR